MSEHSLDDFYDDPVENQGPGKLREKENKTEETNRRKKELYNKFHTSDLSLLTGYVVINVETGYKEEEERNYLPSARSSDNGEVDNNTDDDSDTSDEDSDTSDDQQDGSDEEDDTARTHVSIPQLDDVGAESGSASYDGHNSPDYNEADESTYSDDQIGDDGTEDSDQENDEDYDSESHDHPIDNPPLEGQMSPAAQTSLTRLSTLNSSLYKTDGEDLSDVALTRSYATLHRQEMVDAGAKTIGELYVGLKRRRAQEITEAENGQMGTSQIIQKRNTENEKLKKKPQKLPKSTIPFIEKTADKSRQKQVADDSSTVTVPKKSMTGRSRTSPVSGIASGIDLAPEVRGDMGNIQARVSLSPSEESLTPESLTRLCHTNTGSRSTGEDRSRYSQPLSDEDSRAGFISGRKNPQAKPRAANREASKSRIPLPIYNKMTTIPPIGQSGQPQHIHVTDLSTNSVNNPIRYPRDGHRRYTNQFVQVANPREILTKGTGCTIEKKPPIPHQMKSVACYHNGKLDVSIHGDREIIYKHENDPLDLQITLVPQVKGSKKKEKKEPSTVLPPLKNAPRSGQNENRRMNQEFEKANKSKNKSAKVKLSGKNDKRKINNRTRNLKPLPPLKRVNMNFGFASKSSNTRWVPSKSLMEHKIRRDRIVKGNKVVDLDVVHHRAQYPPFNTYTDPEASARFQKIWCSL